MDLLSQLIIRVGNGSGTVHTSYSLYQVPGCGDQPDRSHKPKGRYEQPSSHHPPLLATSSRDLLARPGPTTSSLTTNCQDLPSQSGPLLRSSSQDLPSRLFSGPPLAVSQLLFRPALLQSFYHDFFWDLLSRAPLTSSREPSGPPLKTTSGNLLQQCQDLLSQLLFRHPVATCFRE